ncbi:MAG TPA: VOC family protein [Candidatus Limnocylindrales bacterium]|nr:VOC family protein [Candidatus Limnocylindrales bacterium]
MTRSNVPVWVDLTSPDVAASAAFYTTVLGWEVEVSPDPQYGGYATARVGGASVAGIAAQMDASNPIAWHLYIGTDDAAALAAKVAAAGGTVVVPGFDVGDQGQMALYQDPSGAFISAWQPAAMEGFAGQGLGAYGWAELNARGLERALPFYEQAFGWTARTSPMGEGQPDYTEFRLGDQSVAGAWELNPAIPAEVPSYWLVYFWVADLEAAFATAIGAGATEMVGPTSFPGGRFAIITDPQGAMVGLLETS